MQLTQIFLLAFAATASAAVAPKVTSATPAINPKATPTPIDVPILHNISTCAQSCAKAIPPTYDGKPSTLCHDQTWLSAFGCCVEQKCSAVDQKAAFKAAKKLCHDYENVKISPPTNCGSVKNTSSSTIKNLPKSTLKTTAATAKTSTAATGKPAATGNPIAVAGYVAKGCYGDLAGGKRALDKASYVDAKGMTVATCVGFCKQKGYNFAGLEYAQECWCGNGIGNGGAKVMESGCDMPCKGDKAEVCGGSVKLGVYQRV